MAWCGRTERKDLVGGLSDRKTAKERWGRGDGGEEGRQAEWLSERCWCFVFFRGDRRPTFLEDHHSNAALVYSVWRGNIPPLTGTAIFRSKFDIHRVYAAFEHTSGSQSISDVFKSWVSSMKEMPSPLNFSDQFKLLRAKIGIMIQIWQKKAQASWKKSPKLTAVYRAKFRDWLEIISSTLTF